MTTIAPRRFRGNTGRRYLAATGVANGAPRVQLRVRTSGLTPVPTADADLSATDATDYGVAIIEAAALARIGEGPERHMSECVHAANGRRYLAEPTAAGRVRLVVMSATGDRELRSLTDTMDADEATAYGVTIVETAAESRRLWRKGRTGAA